jgi:hypothetical protein
VGYEARVRERTVYGPLQYEEENWIGMFLVGNLETETCKGRYRKRKILPV